MMPVTFLLSFIKKRYGKFPGIKTKNKMKFKCLKIIRLPQREDFRR